MPPDAELSWPEVELQFQAIPGEVRQLWAEMGIVMPNDAAEDLMLTMIESFLTATAGAVGLPVAEIYGARNRIKWMTWTDTPDLRLPTFASLDGGAPGLIVEAEKS